MGCNTRVEGLVVLPLHRDVARFDELQKDKEYLQMSIYLQIYGLKRQTQYLK
jgi:hypothetical protein